MVIEVANMSGANLKLQACVAAFDGYDRPLQLRQALQPVSEAYHRNVRRVASLAMFLPAIAIVSMQTAALAERVRHRLKGASESEIRAAVGAEIREHAAERRRVFSTGDAEAREMAAEEAEIGFDMVGQIAFGYDAVQAWLAAMITGTWTAFEAMAENLWEAALNAHPRGLAELKGNRNRTENDRNVPLWSLQKYNYDLSRHMGTLLREKYHFDRLDEMRRAYVGGLSHGSDGSSSDAIADAPRLAAIFPAQTC